MSSLPACARPHLERQLDWGNEGVDVDLNEIADHMIRWEEKLSTHLDLTEVDIYDITEGIRNLSLQRYIAKYIMSHHLLEMPLLHISKKNLSLMKFFI